MIKTMVHSLKTQSDADKYSDDMNELLRNGWEFIDDQKEYYDSAWNIFSLYEKAVVEELPTPSPKPPVVEESIPEPDIAGSLNWLKINATEWKRENPNKKYSPSRDSDVILYMEDDAEPIDYMQVNLPSDHSGIIRLVNLKVDVTTGRSGIKFAQSQGINQGHIQIFNCHVEGKNLVDAYHISVRNSHVVMLGNTCDNVGSASKGHADAFQQPDGHRYLYVDGFKGTNLHFQGFFLPSEDPNDSSNKWNKEGETYLKNIYLEGESEKYLMSLYQNWNSKDVWLENVTCHRIGNIDKPIQFKNYSENGRTSDFNYKVENNVVVFKDLTKSIHGVINTS